MIGIANFLGKQIQNSTPLPIFALTNCQQIKLCGTPDSQKSTKTAQELK